jgi:hypothetical protein
VQLATLVVVRPGSDDAALADLRPPHDPRGHASEHDLTSACSSDGIRA